MSELIGRAFTLLNVIVTAERPLRLMELVERTNGEKSAVHRLLRFLLDGEYVLRDPETMQYRIGPAFVAMSAATMSRSDLSALSRPYAVQLRDLTNETVSVHLRVGCDRVCVQGAESTQEIRSIIPSGERRALYRGISGKIILAFASDAEAKPIRARAEADGLNLKTLDAQLKKARSLGALWEVSDLLPDASVLSVPVFDAHAVKGSLTVSGPKGRWNSERSQQYFLRVKAAADKISRALGARSDERRSA